jgi:hypothetical protein
MCIVSLDVFVVIIPRSGGCKISNNNTRAKILRVFILRPGETGPDLREGGTVYEPLV